MVSFLDISLIHGSEHKIVCSYTFGLEEVTRSAFPRSSGLPEDAVKQVGLTSHQSSKIEGLVAVTKKEKSSYCWKILLSINSLCANN